MQPWPGAVTPERQKKIDEAIARGVKFLRDTQFADGSWASTGIHTLGCTALPALTLLECGASPKDPGIVAAFAEDLQPGLHAGRFGVCTWA